MHARPKPPKAKKDVHINEKGKSQSQPTLNIDIKCFKCLGKGNITSQCPNQIVMLTRDNENIEYESEQIPPLEDNSDEETAYPING